MRKQIEYVLSKGPFRGPKRVLVIGASTGYGLASRIVSAFGCKADTVGVAFEREASENRTGTSGWYNTLAFEEFAKQAGRKALSLNGDAFSSEVKEEAAKLVGETLGAVDMVVYSLASPVRTDPVTGITYRSVLKPIGRPFSGRSLDFLTAKITEASFEPATEEEIAATVKVMGGEDWDLWMDTLSRAGLLAEGALTVAYSYIGPELTYAIYREGTIGMAKAHLEQTAETITHKLARIGGRAYVSVNKALVTRASAVIPVVPLYISLLYEVMKEKGLHEGCIEQALRLFREKLFSGTPVPLDAEGRIRMDDWELRQDVQDEVKRRWNHVNEETLFELADVEGYRKEFFQFHGFEVDGVDYNADVNP